MSSATAMDAPSPASSFPARSSSVPIANSVFVRGLPDDATADHLKAAFAKFGAVLDSTRVLEHKHVGFVDFDSSEVVAKVLSSRTPISILNVPVTVEARNPYPPPTVFVSPLPAHVTAEALKAFFETSLNVAASARLSEKSDSANAKYGFVELPTREDADNAIRVLNGHEVWDVELTVQYAHSSRSPRAAPGHAPTVRSGRGGGRAGGHALARHDNEIGAGHRSGSAQRASSGGRPSRSDRAPQEHYVHTAHVSGLPQGTEISQLEQVFSRFGKVLRAQVFALDNTYAFVDFESELSLLATCTASDAGSLAPITATPSKGSKFSVHLTGFTSVPTQAELTEKFSQYGPVAKIRVMPAHTFGFVSFETEEALNAAIAASGQVVLGSSAITVALGKSREPGGAPGRGPWSRRTRGGRDGYAE